MAGTATDAPTRTAAPRQSPKLASGPFCCVVPASSRHRSRLRTSTGLVCQHRRERTSDAAVARYYDPGTGQFLTRDPLEDITGQPYSYADDDPIDGSDPTGMGPCFWNYCLTFDPGAAVNALVNVGRGASGGLTDTIDNLLSPGSSCTVAQNGIDEFLGGAATTTVFGELRAIRGAYVGLARTIPFIAESPEDAYELRNGLKVAARELTPRPFQWIAQARTTEPFDQLLELKGSQGVIDGAGRTNPWVNFFFGLG